MSKAATSPTARLLQTSRLFSLPRPLPSPNLEGVTGAGLYRASDTATTPYPTHQAITTPRSSLHRGDFGLKRALPAKTTRNTSTPHVRIKAQDTFEHVTEFASAADHTQSREKWLEMGVPILRRRQRREQMRGEGKPESVFEGYLDNTDPEALENGGSGRVDMLGQEPDKQRWKFGSPWLAGMVEGEFKPWLKGVVKGKGGEAWTSFLWEELSREDERLGEVQGRLQAAEEAGRSEEVRATKQEKRQLLDKMEKELRDDHLAEGLSSRLSTLITKFLDLPPIANNQSNPGRTSAMQRWVDEIMADTGPPTTHPSAGLSHLRTNAIMSNHPIYGPQKHRTPVESRVVRPRFQASGLNDNSARIGVGGFVTEDPITATYNEKTSRTLPEPDRMASRLDADVPGGNKLWVHPETAHIDEKGMVRLTVSRADSEALAVKNNNVEHIHEAKRAGLAGPARVGSTGSYRAAPPTPAPKSRMEGFDALVGKGMTEKSATDWMKRMADEHKASRS